MVFSLNALLVASVGIYGALAFSVQQRRHSIAVRMALGAKAKSVVAGVLHRGGRMIVLGLVLGGAGALVFGRGLSSLLYGVTPFDPVTYLGVVGTLATVGLLAMWVPAARATRVAPQEVLKSE